MQNFSLNFKKFFVFGVLVLLVAVIFRISYLNSLPVFADEAIYIRWSQVMRAEQNLRFLPLSDGKQPLYMWLTIPFLKIFHDPLVAGRVVSVVSGIGTLAGIFVLSHIFFASLSVSLVASFIYSISPFSVFFDRLALADSLLSFFGIWTLIFAVITVKKIRLDSAMFAGFSLGGALLTKSPALYFTLLTPLTLLLTKLPKKFKQKFFRLCIYIFLFTFTYLIGYGMYNILRLGPNFHMIAIRNTDYVYPLSHILSSPLDPLKPFLIRILEYFLIFRPWEIVGLSIVGVFIGLRKFPKETILLIFWAITPILASAEFSKTMTARYIFFSMPFVAVLASLTFFNGTKPANVKSLNLSKTEGLFQSGGVLGSHFRKLMLFLLLVFGIHSFYANVLLLTNPQKLKLPRSERSGYLEDWTSGYGIKQVSEYLRNEQLKNPSAKIVIGTEGYFGTLPDGLQIYLNDLPQIIVIGVGQPVREVGTSLLESKNAGNDTYLVVNSTRLLSDADKMGIKLIAEYPKGVKPDGSIEKLLLFRL